MADEEQDQNKNSENPFEEEFDKSDVVNPDDKEREDDDKKRKVETDDIIDYDEQKRKQENFKDIYSEASEPLNEEKRRQENFNDFLDLPNIAGAAPGLSDSKRIPKEKLNERHSKIRIADDPKLHRHNDERSTVIVNRNENDEIVSIEVLCSCGEKTVIKLEYEE